jgi:hypothetical protein
MINMFQVTAKSINTHEVVKIAIRENAEVLAEQYYECDDIYAVEIMSLATGEILYYKAKG